MEVIYVLLPSALIFAAGAVALFAWAARSGQFDDLETPALRILGDDSPCDAPARDRPTDAVEPANEFPAARD
jgi:cbb3-type cytochrome oxidase maturation protein